MSTPPAAILPVPLASQSAPGSTAKPCWYYVRLLTFTPHVCCKIRRSAIETARPGDQGRRSRTSRQLITANTTAVSALSGAGENNPMQPLLPRGGRRRDSWLSASSESELG
ncbi:unnamed protein product [Ectocarpus sp. 12 AP-2014]